MIYIYIEFLASHFNDLSCCISKFTGWVIIEELSIHRWLCTFLVSRGQKICVKHCYADLSSWYEFWFAITCIDMIVILDLSTTIQQFHRLFRFPNGPDKWANTENHFYWNTMTGNNSSTDGSLLRKNVKIKCKEYFHVCLSKWNQTTWVLQGVKSFLIA